MRSSFTVSLQFPPFSAAKSTMTEPGFMLATMSDVQSSGASRFGINAVVMTISISGAISRNFDNCAAENSGDDTAA